MREGKDEERLKVRWKEGKGVCVTRLKLGLRLWAEGQGPGQNWVLEESEKVSGP